MDATHHFGDGTTPFTFFKDKGGKRNHMRVAVESQCPFFVQLVFEDGLSIPAGELRLKGVPLLDMLANGDQVAYLNEKGEEVLSQRAFEGAVDFRFRIMHVSRHHLHRSFRLRFVDKDGAVLHQTVPIEVRSKLKIHQTYPPNSSMPPQGLSKPPTKRRRDTPTRPRSKKRVKKEHLSNEWEKSEADYVSRDSFNRLLANVVAITQHMHDLTSAFDQVSERLDMLSAFQCNDSLLDPEALHNFF